MKISILPIIQLHTQKKFLSGANRQKIGHNNNSFVTVTSVNKESVTLTSAVAWNSKKEMAIRTCQWP